MTYARFFAVCRGLLAALCGATLGGFLAFASAQESQDGWLNADCADRCAANGYEAEFCQSVCWVPNPAAVAEGDNLDWKCFEACVKRGGTTRTCLASCRRY